jgi:hypothetical protein
MTDVPRLLIVRQRPVPHAELESLAEQLHGGFGLDPYTTRQHLLGAGLAQLAQGAEPSLDGMAGLLRRHGYPCWVVVPPRPAFQPPRLRSLSISAAAVVFDCEGERRVRLARGAAAVGVLADLSGELPARQARRLLAQHAYLGRSQATVFTPEELRQAILRAQPVFDCYLLDAAGAVDAAFRVFPGRFNAEGLGGRASLGAARNLEAVVELVGEYAGTFRLYCDFGLSPLAGCQPQPTRDDPQALLGNLDALTRYGWLVASLAEPPAPSRDEVVATQGPVLAAALGGSAVIAGMDVAATELSAVATTVDEVSSARPAAVQAPVKPAPLPPPPERPEQKASLRRALPVLAAFLGGALLAAAASTDLVAPFFRQTARSGLLPGAAAIALCWGAFACLRLKRRIEDTPTSRIRSLAMGLIEVHGRTLRRYALVTPMTQSACAWYRLRKYRRDSRNRWSLVSDLDSGHVPFLLDDGSGQVVVDPAGATVKASTRQTGYPGENTLIGASVDGGPDEKWVEELIYEGTSLYVLGYARPARGVESGLRERTVEALRRLKLDPRARHRYDTDGDGRLDADEWQAARDDAERLAAAAQLNEPTALATGQSLIGKPPRGLPFLIAEAQSGAELSRRYGWGGAVLLVLGLAAAGTALLMFLDYYRLL